MEFRVIDGILDDAQWTVGSVLGQEALNDHFSFSVTLATHYPRALHASHAELHDELLGRAFRLKMHQDDTERCGIIAAVEIIPRRAEGMAVQVRLTLRPRAWLLTLRKNTRIFQGLYVHQIVSLVLAESDVCHRWNLANVYPRRVFCTQYQETDDEFVRRILAEEGIFFFYEHAASFAPTTAPGAESDPLAMAGGVAAGAGALLGAIATAAQGSAQASGTVGVIGAAGSIVGDAISPETDPEFDDAQVGGTGAAGTATTAPTEVFVFCDKADGYAAGLATDNVSPLTVHYRSDAGGVVTDAVTAFAGVRTVGTCSIEIRDYDFRRPLAQLASKDEVEDPHGLKRPPSLLEHYEHHGEYEKPDISVGQAQTRLEQLRASTDVVAGESTCPRMMPGFALDLDHAPAPFASGRYVPTRVIHEASDAKLAGTESGAQDPHAARAVDAVAMLLREIASGRHTYGEGELRARLRDALNADEAPTRQYQNRFEWVAADVAFRPPRPARIRNAVSESAVVVGPAGQSIYGDAYGRVKVQFQWDRHGKYNEASSCWIRVLSTWAGAGYGFQFLPRVGMEVVVSFLGGDPDRPVISGSLYNATHPTPEPLPQRLTRSGMRSQTVPGGGGFNEVSFEDAQGLERVFIHAQKDLHEIVNDAHHTTVRGDQSTNVGADQTQSVGGDRIVAVGGQSSLVVGKNHSEQIAGDRVEHVRHNSMQHIHGSAIREVRGVAIAETASDDLHVVRGDHSVSVQGHHAMHVVIPVEGQKASSTTYVDGSSFLTATERVLIRADQNLRLQCGDSFVDIKSDTITISTAHLNLSSTDTIVIKGPKIDVTGSDHVTHHRSAASVALTDSGFTVAGAACVTMKTSSAKLLLDGGEAELTGSSEARVKGAAVKLLRGSASDSATAPTTTSESTTPTTKQLKVAFVHPRGSELAEPIRNVPFRLTAGDTVHQGSTDGDGVIDVAVPEHTTQADVVLYVDQMLDYEARYKRPLVWKLHVESDLHAPGDVQGARLRLRNLGYAPGPDLTVTELEKDPITTQALAQFQLDRGLPPSGKLTEDDTTSVLDNASGNV